MKIQSGFKKNPLSNNISFLLYYAFGIGFYKLIILSIILSAWALSPAIPAKPNTAI